MTTHAKRSAIPARASRTQEHKRTAPVASSSVGIHPEDAPHLTRSKPTTEQTQYGTRPPTSTRRYDNSRVVVHDLRKNVAPQKQPIHWAIVAGGAVVVTVVLVYAGSAIHTAYENYQNDLHYGTPRTYQMEAVVGHNDSAGLPSHFIAMNLHSHIKVIELPGQDSSKAKIYDGPSVSGNDSDLIPVTLTFKDVNHDGKLDMIVTTQIQDFTYINDGRQFRPAKQGEL